MVIQNLKISELTTIIVLSLKKKMGSLKYLDLHLDYLLTGIYHINHVVKVLKIFFYNFKSF